MKKGIIFDITYINYAHNRDLNPDIEAKKWELVYGKKLASDMEKQYQKEKKK